jgi:hypothetical protein
MMTQEEVFFSEEDNAVQARRHSLSILIEGVSANLEFALQLQSELDAANKEIDSLRKELAAMKVTV